jgi:hypothetical protein
MTEKQRKFAIGCAVLLFVWFGLKFIVGRIHQAQLGEERARRALQQRKPQAAPAPPDPRLALARQFDPQIGLWSGTQPLPGWGACMMRFELRKKPNEVASYFGYPTLSCIPTPPRSAVIHGTVLRSPLAAILSGAPQNGSLVFTLDKTVTTETNGCSFTAFSVTPFGQDKVAAQWQEGQCADGQQPPQVTQMLLNRMRW